MGTSKQMICSGCRDGSAFGAGEHRQPMAGGARGRREERRDREALDLAESSEARPGGWGPWFAEVWRLLV